jgi:hypothetical protein
MNVPIYINVISAEVYVSVITKIKQFARKKFYVVFNHYRVLSEKTQIHVYTFVHAINNISYSFNYRYVLRSAMFRFYYWHIVPLLLA